MKRKKSKKIQKGITLIALVVTIIIMLILTSITVNVIIEGGLFEYAAKTKYSVEVASEKETIQKAFILAEGASKTGRVTKTEFQNAIDNVINENNAIVYDFDGNFKIIFETKRAYTIDKKGKILGMEENYKNPNKTFLAQVSDSTYGTAEKPYEINCIEDLVDLSYAVNGIEILEDGSLSYTAKVNYFANKNIVLSQNLNFTSELSYENATRIDYGDINGNKKVEDLLTELTTGKGWIPIGNNVRAGGSVFTGIFNANGKKISNFYIYNEEVTSYVGLFGNVRNGIVTNLSLSGNIYCDSRNAGGIIAFHHETDSNTYTMNNCSFSGKIENTNVSGITGGLIGVAGGLCEIVNSYNKGIITTAKCAGGIIGQGGNNVTNCYNTGEITGSSRVGGIVGQGVNTVENCYNTGTIIATGNEAGGIIGTTYASNSNGKIYRCYNRGIVNGVNYVGGILGYMYSSHYMTIEQCYNEECINGEKNIGGIVGCISGVQSKILNCYNKGDLRGTAVGGIGRFFSSVARTSGMAVSCYNTGNLNSTNKSGVLDGTTYNSYYLSSCGATDNKARSLLDEDLKASASTLDKKYTINETDNTVSINETEVQNVWVEDINNINSGYPIFSWQVPENNTRRIKI